MAVFRGNSSVCWMWREIRWGYSNRVDINSKNGRWGEPPGEWPSQRRAWLPPQNTRFCSSVLSQACSHCPLGYSSPINPGTFYPLLCPCLVCSGVRVKTDTHSRTEQCGLSWDTEPLEWVFKGHRERCPVYANWLFWPGGRLAHSKDSPIRTNGQVTL